jgi:predicted Fe-S protein YdhL (DUF1289 family)
MENWKEITLAGMEESLAGTREKDLRFFRIEELQRNICRVAEYSHQCTGCMHLRPEIAAALKHVNEAVNVPGQYRRELDRVISRLARHMMKAHSFYPPFHFNYLYSFYGIAAGSLAGLLIAVFLPGKPWEIGAAGFVAGLIAGQIAGGRKDGKVRSENRLM